MDDNPRLVRLAGILHRAATAPGNRVRFQAAGLLSTAGEPLVGDWQSAFLRLAPLTKASVRAQPGQFLARATDITYSSATSGSRGTAFHFFAGTTWNQVRWQTRQQMLTWWHLSAATPVLNVASRLLPAGHADRALVGPIDAQLGDRLRQELTARPAILRGYPSRLCEVATVLRATACQPPTPLAVICTGELLFEQQRDLLARTFNAPVVNEYGCQEAGVWGLTCPEAGRLHLAANRCWLEVCDGELLATDLYNEHLPLVRYAVGDRLNLAPAPCPCGRPGPTARLLGRSEDRLRTVSVSGWRSPGEIAMPALPNIDQYRAVRISSAQLLVQIQPSSTLNAPAAKSDRLPKLDWTPVRTWAQQNFGAVAIACEWLEPTPESDRAMLPALKAPDWARRVLREVWVDERAAAALPPGAAQSAARLLQELVNPSVIANRGLSVAAQSHFESLLAAPAPADPEVEQAIARILLLALSVSAGAANSAGVYPALAQRLHAVTPQALDRLIPTLWCDRALALEAWSRWAAPDLQLDPFSLRHLLYAFETAVARARTGRYLADGTASPLPRTWTPLPALLLGDLSDFAACFHPAMLAMWVQFVHGVAPASDPPPDPFLRRWLAWRATLLDGAPDLAQLDGLQAAAQSPTEWRRGQLERAYYLLAVGQPLDPDEWLAIFEQAAAAPTDGQRDPVPWAPVLRAIAEPLRARGEGDRAYQCLTASTVPSSRRSTFDRQALSFNRKQAMLADLGTI